MAYDNRNFIQKLFKMPTREEKQAAREATPEYQAINTAGMTLTIKDRAKNADQLAKAQKIGTFRNVYLARVSNSIMNKTAPRTVSFITSVPGLFFFPAEISSKIPANRSTQIHAACSARARSGYLEPVE